MLLVAGLVVAALATVGALVGVGYWVRRHHDGPAVRLFTVLLAVNAAWTGLVGVRPLVGRDLSVLLFELDHVVSWAAPPLWLAFVLQYAGRDYLLTRRRVAAAGTVYVVLAALAVTNRLHWVVYADYGSSGPPLNAVVPEPTPLYFVVFGLIYCCLLVGLAVLVTTLLNARRGSRGQLALVLLSALLPVALNLAERGGVLPAGFEYTALGSGLFAVGMAAALFRGDLFAVDPVARDAVLEAAEEGFVVVDRQGRVADYNDAAAALFPAVDDAFGSRLVDAVPALVGGSRDDHRDGEGDGLPGPTVVGDGGADGAGAERRERDTEQEGRAALPALERAEQFDADRVVDEVTVFAEDERRRLRVSTRQVRRGDAVQGHVLVLRDLTEVERYAARLEQQTRQLDRFASTVSHDLRNPLGLARASASRLAAGDADGDAVDDLTESLDRMDALIEDALTLAREGQAIEDREIVSLPAVTRAAWRMVAADDDDAGHRLVVDCDGRTVYADRDRLQRAVENLLRNAVVHGGDGVTVTVGVTESGFYVADDGPGVPEEDRERVFDQGYTTSEEGTGLGLPIVATIVEAHGWSVDLRQSDDGGARFVVDGVEFGPERDLSGTAGRSAD